MPQAPEYDTYDLVPWLKVGENVVTVEVNAFGEGCFQAVEGPGGFIAWSDADSSFDLGTPGLWRCLVSRAWDAEAPSWSFAQGPVEILDYRLLPAGVFEPGFDDSEWPTPTVHAAASGWGTLQPRSIPTASGEVREFQSVRRVAPLANSPRVGFRVGGLYGKGARYAYATFIYSPREQEVRLQLFWGPHFLNGTELHPASTDTVGNRLPYRVLLCAGWNLLCGAPESLYNGWAQLISWSASAELVLRDRPDFGSRAALRRTDGLPAERLGDFIQCPPRDLAGLEAFDLPWILHDSTSLPASPCLMMGWDEYGPAVSENLGGFPLVLPAAEATVLFDFAGEFLGQLEIELSAPPGAIMDVAYGELLRPDGTLLILDRFNVLTAERYVTAAPRQLIQGFHPRGGRYLQVTVRASAPATLHRVAIRSALQPRSNAGAGFVCSDPVLTRAWEMGRDTLFAAREDAWLDCPLRERGAYIGDGLVQSRAYAPLEARDPLTVRCLRLWAASQRSDGQLIDNYPSCHEHGFGDYTLLFVHLLHAHWKRTGNRVLVRELFPVVRRIFAGSCWESDPDGLWVAGRVRVFIDWAVPPEGKRGASAVLNALRVQALRLAAEMADHVGFEDGAAWRAQAEAVAASFQGLWDAEAGCYAGTRLQGRLLSAGRLHANLLALAYDLAPPGRVEAVIAFVRSRLARNHELKGDFIELYFHHFAAEALYHCGLVAEAEVLFRESHRIMQGHGAWTLWECLHRGVVNYGSLCHAWSAAFNWVAAERILGVRPARPGQIEEFVVAPESEMLEWAEGAVAHPRGLICVAWRVEGERLRLAAEAPPGVSLAVAPAGRLGRLRLERSPIFSPSANLKSCSP